MTYDTSTENGSGRWIADTGLPGYGPDASNDSYQIATSWLDLADMIETVLKDLADSEYDSAEAYAGNGDYESAWRIHKMTEYLANLAANFSNERQSAPLYAGSPETWHRTILHLIEENFPLDVNQSLRVYVWQSDEYAADEDE